MQRTTKIPTRTMLSTLVVNAYQVAELVPFDLPSEHASMTLPDTPPLRRPGAKLLSLFRTSFTV